MKPAIRDHVLKIASELFDRRGYTATGVDLIVSASGVAKKTLYTYFKSKDGLIVAALNRRLEEQSAWLQAELTERSADARGRLVAIFESLEDEAAAGRWTTCPFTAAAAEFPIEPASIRGVIRNERETVMALVLDLCRRAGAPDALGAAMDLVLVRHGAIAAAMAAADGVGHHGTADATAAAARAAVFRAGRACAERLLETHGVSRRNSGLHLP